MLDLHACLNYFDAIDSFFVESMKIHRKRKASRSLCAIKPLNKWLRKLRYQTPDTISVRPCAPVNSYFLIFFLGKCALYDALNCKYVVVMQPQMFYKNMCSISISIKIIRKRTLILRLFGIRRLTIGDQASNVCYRYSSSILYIAELLCPASYGSREIFSSVAAETLPRAPSLSTIDATVYSMDTAKAASQRHLLVHKNTMYTVYSWTWSFLTGMRFEWNQSM